jgi:Raf kinase inhibitor-like YbhB/YbcL family protein
LTLRSPAFADGERIPDRFARSHGNVSPPLEWTGAPSGTKSFALLVEDPDAPRGIFRHWVAFDIAPDRARLEEGAGRGGNSLRQGANDFGDTGYDGPEPPAGDAPHHYHFRLAALDVEQLDVGPQQRAEAVWSAIEGHVLEETEIIGVYQRDRTA